MGASPAIDDDDILFRKSAMPPISLPLDKSTVKPIRHKKGVQERGRIAEDARNFFSKIRAIGGNGSRQQCTGCHDNKYHSRNHTITALCSDRG